MSLTVPNTRNSLKLTRGAHTRLLRRRNKATQAKCLKSIEFESWIYHLKLLNLSAINLCRPDRKLPKFPMSLSTHLLSKTGFAFSLGVFTLYRITDNFLCFVNALLGPSHVFIYHSKCQDNLDYNRNKLFSARLHLLMTVGTTFPTKTPLI